MNGQPVRSQGFVLASSSPRRRELLAMLGYPFEVVVPEVDEEAGDLPPEPHRRVETVARRKAAAVAARLPERVVVAADTVVELDGQILGKPRDRAHAVAMLSQLSGRWHNVYTGLAVKAAGAEPIRTAHSRTEVRFRQLNPTWIERYVDTGEPMDKAGAYGIQGRGALLVEEIRGCYFTVVGLPLVLLSRMLEECGITLL